VSFDYLRPTSVGEALALLREHDDAARLIAGGHSLIPAMKLRQERPSVLIDLAAVGDLRGITVADGVASIGALTTHAALHQHAVLRATVPLLAEAAAVVSDPLIRNRGTLGGALAQADPEGDWPAVMLALDATMLLQGVSGTRRVPATAFFQGARRTALAADEVLTTIEIAVPGPQARSVYLKRMHSASGYALIGVAIVLERDSNGRCLRCRIGVTGAGSHAQRAYAAEAQLVGEELSPARIAAAAALAGAQIAFRGDDQASAAYRRHLLPIYLRRALSAIV
jgi:carbon-monoxide dehydrogenase medium subunit